MLTLALVFQRLAVLRPDLDNGIYSYAEAGFGRYAGFSAAWGYWASNVVGNVFFLTFAMAALGAFLPGLGQGNTVLAVAGASACIWGCHLLIARGVRQATAINRVVTVAKLVPIVVFVIVTLTSFDAGVFMDNFWGAGSHSAGSLFGQVRGTMLVTTFVFLGIEGASVYSRLARRREDVGRATVLGFVSTLALFASVTMVSYGVLPQSQLADARQPAMGAVLGSVVGPWGSTLVDVGVVVSVLGAYLAWTLLNTEAMFTPAEARVMPGVLARTSADGTPRTALLVTNLSVQAFLLLVLVVHDALGFMLSLDAALTLVPYLLAAGYALKLGHRRGPTHPPRPAGRRLLLCLPAVRRRPAVPAPGLPHLRPRLTPLRPCPARAGPAPRSRGDMGRRWPVAARGPRDGSARDRHRRRVVHDGEPVSNSPSAHALPGTRRRAGQPRPSTAGRIGRQLRWPLSLGLAGDW